MLRESLFPKWVSYGFARKRIQELGQYDTLLTQFFNVLTHIIICIKIPYLSIEPTTFCLRFQELYLLSYSRLLVSKDLLLFIAQIVYLSSIVIIVLGKYEFSPLFNFASFRFIYCFNSVESLLQSWFSHEKYVPKSEQKRDKRDILYFNSGLWPVHVWRRMVI